LETSPLVRVIADSLGGRRLKTPRGLGTRPTSDRVREALFMTLEPLQGLRVVDLYAGSGALGIEALSRGAAHADFVESGRAARAALVENLEALDLRARSTLWPLSLPGALARLRGPIAQADVILLDPPYGGDPARALLETLAPMAMKPGVRVILEHHSRDPVPQECGVLRRTRERRYGETQVSTYTTGGPELPATADEENSR
jgi:16S rRNA (guanine966-N2)-methyltransferase